jgi:hypothetical protein
MENQHRKIEGYRELDQAEIDQINALKNIGKELGDLIELLKSEGSTDKRWVAIAETYLQQGIMAAVRSIAKPSTF